MKKNYKMFGLFLLLILALGFQAYNKTLVHKRALEDVNLLAEELTKASMPPAQIKSIRSGLLNIASDVADPLDSSIFIALICMFNAIIIISSSLDQKETNKNNA